MNERPTEREIFTAWLATPLEHREPRTQKEFASTYSVSEKTLCRWKEDDAVRAEVNRRRNTYLDDDLPEVYEALAKKAKEGSYKHIQLVLELAGAYHPSARVVNEVVAQTPDRPATPEYVQWVVETVSESIPVSERSPKRIAAEVERAMRGDASALAPSAGDA